MQRQPGGPPPVFVDRTGRRRRLSILAGAAIGVGLMVSLGLIIAGLFTGSSVPLPGWPDTKEQRPVEAGVGELDTSPGGTSTGQTTTPPQAAPTPAPGATTTRPTVTTSARPSPSDHGQGDVHRSTPSAKPSKSSGKPS